MIDFSFIKAEEVIPHLVISISTILGICIAYISIKKGINKIIDLIQYGKITSSKVSDSTFLDLNDKQLEKLSTSEFLELNKRNFDVTLSEASLIKEELDSRIEADSFEEKVHSVISSNSFDTDDIDFNEKIDSAEQSYFDSYYDL